MNREEKLEFIKENHPELYDLLKEHVPSAIADIWNMNPRDRAFYNYWVSYHFGKLGDSDSVMQLLI